MRAARCLCRSVLRGTENSVPRDDRALMAQGIPEPGSVGELAAATVVVTAATATEAGQKQDPDQPFTGIISAAAVVVQQSATVVVAAAAAEQ